MIISVIWKSVNYNIGDAYNEATGKFTSPYRGIYFFYATSPVHGRYSGDTYIYVNDVEKVHHYIQNDDKHVFDSASPTAVLKLNKGDTVHVHMSGTFHWAGSDCARTYFQGHLIDKLEGNAKNFN